MENYIFSELAEEIKKVGKCIFYSEYGIVTNKDGLIKIKIDYEDSILTGFGSGGYMKDIYVYEDINKDVYVFYKNVLYSNITISDYIDWSPFLTTKPLYDFPKVKDRQLMETFYLDRFRRELSYEYNPKEMRKFMPILKSLDGDENWEVVKNTTKEEVVGLDFYHKFYQLFTRPKYHCLVGGLVVSEKKDRLRFFGRNVQLLFLNS